jgi:hypothetical protein
MQKTRKISRAAERCREQGMPAKQQTDAEDKHSQQGSGQKQMTRKVSRAAERCRGQVKSAEQKTNVEDKQN